MTKILRYDNRKQDAMYWDVSTLEKEMGAFLSLFRYLNKDWKVYEGITQSDPDSVALYKSAKDGNAMAAKLLLTRRNGWEYETWQIEEAQGVDINKVKNGWFDTKKEHEYETDSEAVFSKKKQDEAWKEVDNLAFEAGVYGPSVSKDVTEFFFDLIKFDASKKEEDRDHSIERLEGFKIAGQRAQRNLQEMIGIIDSFIRKARGPKTYRYRSRY